MLKNFNVLYVLFALIPVSLCAQRETVDITVLMKSDRLDTQSFDLSEMVESIDYIRIEDSVLLGNITDIKYWHDCFYLYDKSHQSIVIVNKEGQILSNIARRGRAGNEYISLQAFAIEKTDGSVFIFDNAGRKVVVYTQAGKYLHTVPLPEDLVAFRDIEVTNKGTILLYNPLWIENKYDALVELDLSGRKLRTLFTNDKKHRLATAHIPPDYFSVLSDGSITLMGREDRDLFYRLSPEGKLFSPYHMVTDVSFPSKLKGKVNLNREELSEGNYYEKVFYQETDKWLFFGLRYQRKTKYWIYNKREGKHTY